MIKLPFTELMVLCSILWITNDVEAQNNFKPQYLKISEDNDFINLRGEGTDRFYTNGTRIDMFYTKSKKRRFLTSLLIPVSNISADLYSIGITQQMFTPSDIVRTDIIKEERPYAGLLYANHTLISSDYEHKQRLTTELNLGVIGPASFAKETQTWIHGLTNYQKPLGWDNQVKNDVIINYQIQYEKLLLNPSEKFEMIGLIEANAGTLYNKITTGFTFRAGKYNSYFSNYEKPLPQVASNATTNYRKFQFFFFMNPTFTAFMDNSTLQGGMFTGYNSVHTIFADDLNRFYMQFEYGIFVGTKRFGFTVIEKLRTAEFKNAPIIQVGNFTFFIGL